MAHGHAASLEGDKLFIGGVGARLGIPGLFIGAIALIIATYMGFSGGSTMEVGSAHADHFFYSYLAAYSFFLAVTLGALIFVLIQHAARAGWSVTVRRLAEGLALNVFLMVILILPMFASYNGINGVHRIFHWMYSEVVNNDELLTAKHGYLNPQFFAIRMGLYFGIWMFLAWFYAGKSAEQDHTGDVKTSVTLDWAAAPGIVLFGFSLTAFAFDWIMSLNPHWFSTIFGVYYFAGAMLSALSAIVLLSLALQKRGLIGNAVNHEHYHDLGKLMFAFTFFWGYIAFAQYMLIWYADLPEETQFYVPRQMGPWASVSLMLLVVHFLIPFPGLLSRHVKRKNAVLAFWCVWSLCACAVDHFWLVVPNEWISHIAAESGNPTMPVSSALAVVASPHDIYHLRPEYTHLSDLMNAPLSPWSLGLTALCFIGIGGLYIFSTMFALRGRPLVPLKDPRLEEALAFENI